MLHLLFYSILSFINLSLHIQTFVPSYHFHRKKNFVSQTSSANSTSEILKGIQNYKIWSCTFFPFLDMIDFPPRKSIAIWFIVRFLVAIYISDIFLKYLTVFHYFLMQGIQHVSPCNDMKGVWSIICSSRQENQIQRVIFFFTLFAYPICMHT